MGAAAVHPKKTLENADEIRAVIFRNIPRVHRTTQTALKIELRRLFGPISEIQTEHRSIDRSNKDMVVVFRYAETANLALKQTTKWSNGKRIRASPAKCQPIVTGSDQSRLFTNLNEDCLLHIFKYLSPFDIVHLAMTDPRLALVARENVFPKIARNLAHRLFALGCPTHCEPPVRQICQTLFEQTLDCIGPHVTELTINGQLTRLPNFNYLIQTLLVYCPQIVSLRLFNIIFPSEEETKQLALDARQFAHLTELCLTRCVCINYSFMEFIGKLPQLESLMLHHTLCPYNGTLKCNKLRKFSLSMTTGLKRLLRDVVAQNADTLRELYFGFGDYGTTDSSYLAYMAQQCRHLEAMFFRVPPTSNHGPHMDDMLYDPTTLRTIIFQGRHDIESIAWLKKSPNVEHIVLLELQLNTSVVGMVAERGTKLRTLCMRRLRNASEDVLIRMFRKTGGLEKIVIGSRDLFDTGAVLLAAVESNVNLRSITVWNSSEIPQRFYGKLIRILGGHRKLELTFVEQNRVTYFQRTQMMAKNVALKANNDRVTVKIVWNRDDPKSDDAIPIDQYMLEHVTEQYSELHNLTEYSDHDYNAVLRMLANEKHHREDYRNYEEDSDMESRFMVFRDNGIKRTLTF